MSNDSTVAGYLTQADAGPAYDQDLERIISRWIRGVSGLPVARVIPRQTDPQPAIPAAGVTWCGFGIVTMPTAGYAADVRISDDQQEQWRWEQVDVLCCFYGPQGAATAAAFRDGLLVGQNNETLKRRGLSLRSTGQIYNLPELINNRWIRRYDITVTLSRKTIRTFNIKTLTAASVQFFGD